MIGRSKVDERSHDMTPNGWAMLLGVRVLARKTKEKRNNKHRIVIRL